MIIIIEITLQHKRPNGSLARVILNAKVIEADIKDDKELEDLLFRTEVGANESGDIQAWISMKEDNDNTP